MKVLWLCNVIIPEIAKTIGKEESKFGGWLNSMANDLSNNDNIEFTVCFSVPTTEKFQGKVHGITYYSFTQFAPDIVSLKNQSEMEIILKKTSPDIVHIFGTEFAHALAMIRACQACDLIDKVVVSIQGLISVCAKHYYAYLPQKIVNSWSFRDLIRHDNIHCAARKFERRGQNEIEVLQNIKHVIGRTAWDCACVGQINSNLQYHFCGEILRHEFYKNVWDINACEKYAIFVSQSNYPIKGFHLMIEAFAQIIKRYPNAHLYTTGKNPLGVKGAERLKQTAYSQYIARLIVKYQLENHITFMGMLDEKAMVRQFLKAHVFVSPSSIENSSNSVGEAMLLGVPIVASDVGGITSMLVHEKEGYVYPADEPYMITHYVSKIFDSQQIAMKLSEQSRNHAMFTHNRQTNMQNLYSIYEEISGERI